MKRERKNLLSKIAAAFLSVLMLFSLLPGASIATFAATEDHPDCVTISVTEVKDEIASPLEGATVDYVIYSSTYDGEYISSTGVTGADGCLEILASDVFIADDLTLYATVSKDGYISQTIGTEADPVSVETYDQNFDVQLVAMTEIDLTGLEIMPKTDLVYTGKDQEAFDIIIPETATYELWFKCDTEDWVKYDKDSDPKVIPTVKDADVDENAYLFSFEARQEGYLNTPYNEEALDVNVEKAEQEIMFDPIDLSQDVIDEHNTVILTKKGRNIISKSYTFTTNPDGTSDKVTFTSSNTNFATVTDEGITTFKKPGTVIITANLKGDANHKEASKAVIITVISTDTYYVINNVQSKDGADEYWYNASLEEAGKVTIEPKGGYSIALVEPDASPTDGDFFSEGKIIEDGKDNHTFDIWAKKDGGLQSRVFTNVDIFVDTVAPEIDSADIKYQFDTEEEIIDPETEEPVIDEETEEPLTETKHNDFTKVNIGGKNYIITNDPIIVRFSVFDEISTPYSYQWKKDGADPTETLFNNSDKKDTVNGEFTISLVDDYTGPISLSGTDFAANTSEFVSDGTILVIDRTKPVIESVVYETPTSDIDSTTNKQYFTDTITGTITINEKNFLNPEDVVVKVNNTKVASSNITWENDSDNALLHYGTFTVATADGDYVVTVDYTDKSGNIADTYTSHTLVLDNTNPTIAVSYESDDEEVNTYDDVDYYQDDVVATVTITEHNFNADDVVFTISGVDYNGDSLFGDDDSADYYTISAWTDNDDVHTATITFSGEANYSLEIAYTDLAGNAAESYGPELLTVDKSIPEDLEITYSDDLLKGKDDNKNIKFYQSDVEITFKAADDISGVYQLNWAYAKEDGASTVNVTEEADVVDKPELTFDKETATYTLKLTAEQAKQYRGKISFIVTDKAGNDSGIALDDDGNIYLFVVDTISPTSTVAYNNPVNEENGISYYDGNINATIKINEANFYAEDVVVTVQKDGVAQTITPTWTNSSVDVHIGTFTLTDDADYVIIVNYTDRSTNKMTEYKSNQLTIDTKIEEPTYTINGTQQSGDNGGAYKDDVDVTYHFEDQNYAGSTIKLTRIRFNKVEDVTNEFIQVGMDGKGGSGSFSIPKTTGNDGIYLLTISMTDKANHSTESHVRFTVNRYGSVYEYDEYLCSLIKDGGQYITKTGDVAITKDLVIREYNADRLVAGSLKILITRNGEPINVIYTTSPATINDNTPISANGWYEYVYTISKDNFKEDGVYKITISSKDATGNSSSSIPDNSVDYKGSKVLDTMTFTVDTTLPEITNIGNLEKRIVSSKKIVDGKLNVPFTVTDMGGIAKIEIYLNGKLIDTITDFDDVYTYSGSFDINESSDLQSVRIVVTDLAGNVIDTSDENFDPGEKYVFVDNVIVSSNFFVRAIHSAWFWIVCGVVVAAAIALIIFFAKRRKKDEEE